MSEFTESEIRSKERRLQEIGKKVIACMERERALQTELSRLRKELTSKSSFSNPAQIQRNIADQEKKLADILRERERYEQERGRLSRELEHLQQSLAWEDSLHKEEKKRKQAREKTKKEISHIAAFSAGAVLGAKASDHKSSSKKTKKQKGGVLQTVGLWLLLFLFIGGIVNLTSRSRENVNPSKRTKEKINSVVTVDPTPTQGGMATWIGSSVKEIYTQYGKTDLTGYLSGGNYFYYEDQTVCPYEFFYGEDWDSVSQEDLIYGIGTGVEGTPVIGDMQIGDPLQQVEEMIGTSLSPEIMEGSDFYPYLGTEIQIDGIQYWLYFGPESKNLVYAMAIKKGEEGNR